MSHLSKITVNCLLILISDTSLSGTHPVIARWPFLLQSTCTCIYFGSNLHVHAYNFGSNLCHCSLNSRLDKNRLQNCEISKHTYYLSNSQSNGKSTMIKTIFLHVWRVHVHAQSMRILIFHDILYHLTWNIKQKQARLTWICVKNWLGIDLKWAEMGALWVYAAERWAAANSS